jgi:hypothetical protein
MEFTMSSWARVKCILHSTLCRDVIFLSQSLQKSYKKWSKIIKDQTKLLKNLHVNNTVLFSMHVCTYIDERGINIVGFLVARQYDTWVIIWNNQEIYLVIISINELHLLDIEISNLTYMLLRFRICFWECWMIALRYPSWKYDRLVSPEIWNASIVEFYCSCCGLSLNYLKKLPWHYE